MTERLSDNGKTIVEMCAIIVANSQQKNPDWWAMKMECCELKDLLDEIYEIEKEKKQEKVK